MPTPSRETLILGNSTRLLNVPYVGLAMHAHTGYLEGEQRPLETVE
jgi:hypothetical protein